MTERPPEEAEEARPEPEVPPGIGELQELVDQVVLAVEEARPVPLSGNVMVDRQELLDLLQRLRDRLPDELRAARWMVREREAFIRRTNEKAREIVDGARDRARQMVSESTIVAEAVEEANTLVRRAEGEARRIRLEAEDEAERHLEHLEQLFGSLLEEVRRARAELHQVRPAGPEPPT